MKNQWPLWALVVGVVIVVLFAFNYQGEREFVSLNEIFPEEDVEQMPDITYEFVDEKEEAPRSAPSPAAEQPPVVKAPAAVSRPAARPSPAVAVAKPDLARVPFTIQVLSSKNKAGAERSLKDIQAKGYPADLVQKDLGDKGVWYRIYVGSFPTRSAAEAYLQKVKKDFKDSFIITPK